MNSHTIPVRSDLALADFSNYLKEKVKPHVLAWDKAQTFPHAVFQDLFQFGVMSGAWPKELGGSELKMIDLLTIGSELAYYSPGMFSSWIANIFAQTAIERFGSQLLREKVAKDQIQKRTLLSLCATELETGFDIQRLFTTATPVSGGFRLTGKKHFITNANYASYFVTMARTKNDPLDPGMAVFLIPANAAGVTVGPPLQKLGQHESNTSSIDFADVFVPEEYLLGNIGDGFKILSACISRTKTLIAGGAVGICRRAESEVLTYLLKTLRYGKPLLARHDIQATLVEIKTQAEAAWLLACRAAQVWEEKGTAVQESSMAKYFAADMAVNFVSEALELAGATGYLEENFLSKLYRDVKVLEIYEGASLIQKTLIAMDTYAKILKSGALPKSDAIPLLTRKAA